MEKTVWKFLKKLKTDLPYDAAIPLLGIFPKKQKKLVQKHTHSPMFIALLFTTVKIWKQLKHPSTDQWIKKIWYIHTMEYHSVTKQE